MVLVPSLAGDQATMRWILFLKVQPYGASSSATIFRISHSGAMSLRSRHADGPLPFRP